MPPKPLLTHHDWTGTETPRRLYLSIIRRYVPKTQGTFMVNAMVTDLTMDREVPLKCAVHYVQSPSGLRYRVCPSGEVLTVPSGTSLGAHAEEAGWPQIPREITPVPGKAPGRKTHLPVHVGEWPTAEIDADQRSVLRSRYQQGGGEPLIDPNEMGEAEVRRAAEELKYVPEATRIDGPSGLTSVLQSGRFEVTGDVYFAPLQPFNPDPEIPSAPEEAEKQFMARQQIPAFTYQ